MNAQDRLVTWCDFYGYARFILGLDHDAACVYANTHA